MLEFVNVSKSYWTGTQRKVILDRVSFRVQPGRSLGILAPNGTGKTTLINMMAGLEKPDEGEIHRMCNISFPLGFMGGVISKVSAMENSRYIARLYGLDPDYVEAYCRWLCGLGEYFDQPLGTYSAGMRADLAFRCHGHAGWHTPDRAGGRPCASLAPWRTGRRDRDGAGLARPCPDCLSLASPVLAEYRMAEEKPLVRTRPVTGSACQGAGDTG